MSIWIRLRIHYRGWVAGAVILLLTGPLSLLYGDGPVLLRPRHDVAARSATGPSLHAYEIRTGPVSLAPEILPQRTGKTGRARMVVSGNDPLMLVFFDDVTYQVTVDAVTQHEDDTLTIKARLDDHEIGTVLLTIGAEGYLITLQDMNRALLYRVTGDSRTTAGTVTEIDMKKIPPMIR